jgi:spore coat polysaccharide biosynthesis protein SpsF (cytidylyltransferase family)
VTSPFALDEPRVVAIVTARMASVRYPRKAMVSLAGRPLLEVLLTRIASLPCLDSVALATSTAPENVPLVDLAKRLGIPAFQGDEDDVLRRTIDCAHHMRADHVVRVTGDNPLTDLGTIDRLVALHLRSGAEYTYVPGQALLRSELVTLYIKENPAEFRIRTAELPSELDKPHLRLTVDEADDVKLMQILFERLAKPGQHVETRDAIALLEQDQELARTNAKLRHKPANVRSVGLDARVAASGRKKHP